MSKWNRIVCSKEHLNLKVTLTGGQCFRWRETNQGEWTGVLGNEIWKMRWADTNNLKSPQQLEYSVWSSAKKKPTIEENKETILKYFRLNEDLQLLYDQWSEMDSNFKTKASQTEFKGIRMLSQEPTENIFSFICSSNNNIARISSMVENLCKLFGKEISVVDGKQYHSFPALEDLVQPNVETQLRKVGFGYRAPFIVNSAKKILEKGGQSWLLKLSGLEYSKAKQQLMELPGIGAKVADCICLMSLNHLQAVPVDTHVYQIAVAHYTPHLAGRKSVTTKVYDEISGHFQQLYGPLAGWAHTVLFCADLKSLQEKRSGDKVSTLSKRKKKV